MLIFDKDNSGEEKFFLTKWNKTNQTGANSEQEVMTGEEEGGRGGGQPIWSQCVKISL